MAEDTDFVALYSELGLDAECTIGHFRTAYRRRVAVLHPDHSGPSSDIPRLQRLNRMYAAALEFHRAHGRLPGARIRPASAVPFKVAQPPAGTPPAPPDEHEAPMAGNPAGRRYLVLGVLLVIALYWFGATRRAPPRLDPAGSHEAVASDLEGAAVLATLRIGMDQSLVLQIQGKPPVSDGQRWRYGPSWIDFRCGKVVDWYSSPLRPLRASATPPEGSATTQEHAHRC